MKQNFINKPLILSLSMCSVFTAFVATLGTLYFRQEIFSYSKNIKKIELQCVKLERSNLTLSAYIAQMQTPAYFKEKLSTPLANNLRDRVLKVKNWSDYKESFMTRNALAMNYAKTFQL